MKRPVRRSAVLGILLALLMLVPVPSVWAKTVAVVPIAPMAWLLGQLTNNDEEIITLLPAGASPHSFEVSPQQMVGLAGADIFFTLGLPMEKPIMASLQNIAGNSLLVQLNQGIILRHFTKEEEDFEEHASGAGETHAHEPVDPHTWLNPQNASTQAANMAVALSRINPAGRALYQERLANLQARLANLDARLMDALSAYRGQSFLVYHPAFGYLAERYGLKQVAVEMEGKEPSARRLLKLVDQARQHGVKIIFVQPQFPKAAANRLAAEINGTVVMLDPLAFDYMANLESIVGNLQKGLK